MTNLNEADLIKLDLIKLLSNLKGLPSGRQKQFNKMLKILKEPDCRITAEQRQQISLLIAFLFCGQSLQNFPMTPDNKQLIDTYSKKHLVPEARPTKRVK